MKDEDSSAKALPHITLLMSIAVGMIGLTSKCDTLSGESQIMTFRRPDRLTTGKSSIIAHHTMNECIVS